MEPRPPAYPQAATSTRRAAAIALALSFAWTTLGLLMRTPQAVMSAATAGLIVSLLWRSRRISGGRGVLDAWAV